MGDFLRSIIHQLYNVQEIVRWGGTLLVCTIVFVETGLFVGFFLPGDSLLVTAGVVAAAGDLNLYWLLFPVCLCAIAGDQLGYWIGRGMGHRLYERGNSRFFKKKHIEEAHAFYQEHGRKAVIIARFVPIIRTFCPPVAGAAGMNYSTYLAYDVFGGLLWVCSMILIGFFLGRAVPHVESKIHWVILAVIILSLIPTVVHVMKQRRQSSSKEAAGK